MKTPVLKTDRLILRPVTIDDAPAIQKYFNDWGIIQHMALSVPYPYPDDGAETFLHNILLPQMKAETSFGWGITIKNNGDEVVGIVDYRSEPNDTGNRGFWLARKFQGQGYMSEAIAATQDFLFFEAGVEKFYVTTSIANPASKRVKEKTGGVKVKEIELTHHNGEPHSEIWEITKEGWEAFKLNQDLI